MSEELVHTGGNSGAVQLFSGQDALSHRHADVVELSTFSNIPATEKEILATLTSAKSIWPMTDDAWGAIVIACQVSEISLDRLRYCVGMLLKTHEYGKSFTPAQLLNFDKKIVLAKSISALRSKIKHILHWSDIVMVEWNGERMYSIIDDAKMYNLKILATYEDPYGSVTFVDRISYCEAVTKRKHKFGEVLKGIVEQNIYPVEMMREFYTYWSAIVDPGDVMRFETVWSMDNYNNKDNQKDFLSNKLESWASSHGYPSAFVDCSDTFNKIMEKFK